MIAGLVLSMDDVWKTGLLWMADPILVCSAAGHPSYGTSKRDAYSYNILVSTGRQVCGNRIDPAIRGQACPPNAKRQAPRRAAPSAAPSLRSGCIAVNCIGNEVARRILHSALRPGSIAPEIHVNAIERQARALDIYLRAAIDRASACSGANVEHHFGGQHGATVNYLGRRAERSLRAGSRGKGHKRECSDGSEKYLALHFGLDDTWS